MTAVLTGWGKITVTGPQADVLQEVNVSTITNQQCGEKHGHHRITPAMICAGAPGKDACKGDSGGPLAVLGPDGRYSQIGICIYIRLPNGLKLLKNKSEINLLALLWHF